MARTTQRYNFSTYSSPVGLTLQECQSFFDSVAHPNQPPPRYDLAQLRTALAGRIQQINTRTPSIDGKSTNPFVLAAYAELFDVNTLKQVDDIVAAAKVFSSIETAAGRVVEDIIPPFFGWEQVNSPGHTVLSEIDSARIVGDTVELVALKSGPMCINDSMVAQISSAVSTHWKAWGQHWGVGKVHYIVGMNYSTAKNSNKKDWHIVRLAQSGVEQAGDQITSSCILQGTRLPAAVPFFEAQSAQKQLRVETMQGRALWAHMGGDAEAFLHICWALVLCLDTTAVPPNGSYTTEQMNEIVDFSTGLNGHAATEAQKQWFVLFARHFVDHLVEN